MAQEKPESSGNDRKRPGCSRSWLVGIGIVLATAGIIIAIYTTEPSATREGATRETAMLVDVMEVERDAFTPVVEVMGTVRPAREITLRARVAGQIVRMDDEFIPGGTVDAGRELVGIDPVDYDLLVRQRRSELRRAEANLQLEQGRQEVARQEYALMADALEDASKALVLRAPQWSTAEADVESARAGVRQAELDLERTSVKAPFDAHILSREVDLGSQVGPDTVLARLVGRKTYWVEVTVPITQLKFIDIPEYPDDAGTEVRIRNRSAWPEDVTRQGRLLRLVGALNETTRLARVLVAVDDPLALDEAAGGPALMIGAFVEVMIPGRTMQDVFRLNRDYVHRDETVWVMKDGKLDIREVEVAFRDHDFAYITEGLESGEQVVTSRLATVVEGAALRDTAEGGASEATPEQSGSSR